MNPTTEIKTMLAQMAAESKELQAVAGGPLTDIVSDWLVPQYVDATRAQLASASEAERWKVLRLAANDLVALRRGDHNAARLALDREKFEEFVRLRRAEEERVRNGELNRGGISEHTLQRIEQELRLI